MSGDQFSRKMTVILMQYCETFLSKTIKVNGNEKKFRVSKKNFANFFRTSELDVIYQTRETVFHRDIQTPRRELKIRRAAEYF